mgnify:CR=1 FL=1
MAILPLSVVETKVNEYLIRVGLKRVAQGKVRDIYEIPWWPGALLMLATDRLSIFNIVLPGLVPRKGEVLTALTHFWLTTLLKNFPNHLVSHEVHLALAARLPELPMERCLVVRKIDIIPVEYVFRYHLGGSVWPIYLESGTGAVHGQKLPPGLKKWQKLDEPLFTPTTKAEAGHDEPITIQQYLEETGEEGLSTLNLFTIAYEKVYKYAKARGILFLDTKLEGRGCIADECFTPDSSRIVLKGDWAQAMETGKDPIFYDKQLVREWGSKVKTPFSSFVGLNKLDPCDLRHINFVHQLEVPKEVVKETSRRYLKIFKLLTGQALDEYQASCMGIKK